MSENLIFVLFVNNSYLLIKVREVRIAKEVKRSDAGDVSPVAMFSLYFDSVVVVVVDVD